MTVTLHKPDQATFAAAVATQRGRLESSYANGAYPHLPDNATVRRRENMPRWADFLHTYEVHDLVGLIALVACFVAGWRIDHRYVNGRADGMAIVGGLVVSVAFCVAVHKAGARLLRPHLNRLTYFSASLYVDVDNALDELLDSCENSDEASDLVEAAYGLLPVLEVLAEEEARIAAAIHESRYAAHRGDYRATLTKARAAVQATMLDVTAELMAAASVVFAARDDLIVEIANSPKVEDVVFRQTLVTPEVKVVLEDARATLRKAATSEA